MEKRMKHCLFKYSHRTFIFLSFTSWFWGGVPMWRFAPSAHHEHSPPLWMLWTPTLHIKKRWKSEGNTLCVKEVNAFSGNLIRIYAHVKGRFKTDGGIFSVTEPPRLSCPTSRDVLFTTRRLVRTTPGLVRTSPWIGKTSPGLVRITPGLVEKA